MVVERLRVQMAEMEAWKAEEQKLLRRVFRWLLLGLILFALAVGVGVARTNRLAEENRKLITKIDSLNRQQADAVYQACVTRNERAIVSLEQFKKLEKITARDGNPAEAAFWHSYVVKLGKDKLPPCVKPDPNATTEE